MVFASTLRRRRAYRRHLFGLQGGRCYYCIAAMRRGGQEPDSATLDRIIPGSEGGTYTLGNLVVACQTCNLARGPLTADLFLQIAKRLGRERLHKAFLGTRGFWAIAARMESEIGDGLRRVSPGPETPPLGFPLGFGARSDQALKTRPWVAA